MQSLTWERMSADLPNEQLVAAAKFGDREAFSSLFARDRDLVFAFAYARLGNREDAEDVLQETFVRAYQSLSRLRGPEAWQGWLLQIARNLCHDALRRRRVRQSEPLDPDWLDGGPTPETQILSEERRRALNTAVHRLPHVLREPIVMRFGSGCSRKEIAVALGVPESTVMGRLARAMRQLRVALGEEWDR